MPLDNHYLKNELYELIRKEPYIFDFLQKGSLDGIWYWDLIDTDHEWMSPRFWEVLGYEPSEKKHSPSEWQELINPDDLQVALENFEKHCQNPEHPYDQIVRYCHKDGSTVWVRCRGTAIRDEHGIPIRMLGAHNELTQFKQSEEALQKSEERFRSYFMNDQTVKLIIDLETGKIQDANDSALTYYGYDKDKITKKTIYDINVLPNKVIRKQMVKSAQGHQNHFLMQHRLANGEIRDVEVFATPLKLKHQLVSISTIYDITEKKFAEAEREKLQAQLLQAQKMESVGRLAGGVAHDFNNMLSVILGHTEMMLIENTGQDSQLLERLEEIKKAAEHSADLTSQLLAFARKQTVFPKILDLNKIVENTCKILKRLIGEDIDLKWIPGKKLWPVKIDPSQVDQILSNLCVNSRDAIKDVGNIIIETDNVVLDEIYCSNHTGFIPGEYVLLAVSDDGCGMDAETLSNIFEPFFTTKESGRGTGLGLATVYGIIKQNQSFVNVYSELDTGTTVKIYFPRNRTKEETYSKETRDFQAVKGHETILLVEDEQALLSITCTMLERLGYKVLVAGTPGEALRLGQEYTGEIHLLLTDVVMPKMNGRDLTKKILSIHPDIEHLFMSGYTANIIAHYGILGEGVNFINKPFLLEQLGVKIREVLDKKEL